jgi:hypothetical protein
MTDKIRRAYGGSTPQEPSGPGEPSRQAKPNRPMVPPRLTRLGPFPEVTTQFIGSFSP